MRLLEGTKGGSCGEREETEVGKDGGGIDTVCYVCMVGSVDIMWAHFLQGVFEEGLVDSGLMSAL